MKRNLAIVTLIVASLFSITGSVRFSAIELTGPFSTAQADELENQQVTGGHETANGILITTSSASWESAAQDRFSQTLLTEVRPLKLVVDEAAERRAALQIQVNEFKTRRQDSVDRATRESLLESIQRLDTERFSIDFIRPDELGPSDPVVKQSQILHQPRVARVLLEAIHGDRAVREEILSSIMPLLDRHVKDFENRLAGQETSGAHSENQGLAFPIVLAEVDTSGSSLPLLLAWYELEAVGAQRSISALIANGSDIPNPPGLETRSQVMDIIAPAALVILNDIRMSASSANTAKRVPPFSAEFEALLRARRGFKPKPEATGPSLELVGYELPPRLEPSQANAVMQIVRDYLKGL